MSGCTCSWGAGSTGGGWKASVLGGVAASTVVPVVVGLLVPVVSCDEAQELYSAHLWPP